jgi:hypothetical protein
MNGLCTQRHIIFVKQKNVLIYWEFVISIFYRNKISAQPEKTAIT